MTERENPLANDVTMNPPLKRPDVFVKTVKAWISERRLRPGDRLPQERALIAEFGMSKGTVREGLKALETQGLITTRTGPRGGAFVADVPPDRAMSLLSNYFFFKNPSISDIYELRESLEPEMAASLIGSLSHEDFERLQRTMTIYSSPIESPENEHQQRLAEFAFHEVLADLCPNPLLSFFCRFLISLLKNLAICRKIYDEPNPELFDTGRYYQMAVYEALKRGDADEARRVMRRHMQAAAQIMRQREAHLSEDFLPDQRHADTRRPRHS